MPRSRKKGLTAAKKSQLTTNATTTWRELAIFYKEKLEKMPLLYFVDIQIEHHPVRGNAYTIGQLEALHYEDDVEDYLDFYNRKPWLNARDLDLCDRAEEGHNHDAPHFSHPSVGSPRSRVRSSLSSCSLLSGFGLARARARHAAGVWVGVRGVGWVGIG